MTFPSSSHQDRHKTAPFGLITNSNIPTPIISYFHQYLVMEMSIRKKIQGIIGTKLRVLNLRCVRNVGRGFNWTIEKWNGLKYLDFGIVGSVPQYSGLGICWSWDNIGRKCTQWLTAHKESSNFVEIFHPWSVVGGTLSWNIRMLYVVLS